MIVKVLPNDDYSRLARIGVTGDDAPITLKDACRDYLNDAVSVATLKAGHRRGNLVIFKIGRQYFTTHHELNAMVEKCRLGTKPLGSKVGSDNWTDEARARAAQIALGVRLEKLKAQRRKSNGPPINHGAAFLPLARKHKATLARKHKAKPSD